MIPSTLKELARIAELESKLATMERHYDNAVNVVYQAAQKANEIQRTVSGVEGSSLFEDLAAIEAYVRKLTTELDSERERLRTLETRILELASVLDYKANSVDDALKAIAGALAETLYCSVEQMMEFEAAKDAALTENARLRALLNAQDEYAHSGAYVPLVKTEFMGDGD